MGTDKFACLPEVIAESVWRAMGWVCDEKAKCVDSYFEASVQKEEHERVAVH